MDKPKITARDFFLWAGAMIAFYWSVVAFIFLLFNYIDYAFPDALSSYPADPYQSGIGYEMASIIVLFPIYLVLTWIIRRSIAADPSRKTIWVRRWALVLTLFVAGVSMAGDLITLLTRFFNGESLTTAFLIKVALIFLVAAAVFMHFIADLWGYWDLNPGRKLSIAIATGVLAVVAIVSGFFIIGTPAQARQYRFDAQRVSDLQQIQSQVVSYWQQKEKLPSGVADLTDSISGYSAPADPETGAPYDYQVVAPLSFKLCATFSAPTQANATTQVIRMAPVLGSAGSMSDNWYHDSGTSCFTRTIDPSRYPPLKPVK